MQRNKNDAKDRDRRIKLNQFIVNKYTKYDVVSTSDNTSQYHVKSFASSSTPNVPCGTTFRI